MATTMQQQQESFEDSMIFSDGPTTLLDRLGYVKQLIFSKTRLEFRLLWNKIFQKEDEELGWLLNPYRRQNQSTEATMLSSFNKNLEDSYQYGYDDVAQSLGRERVTIYQRGVTRKSDSRRRRKRRQDQRPLSEKALEYARYMGMGVYMTTTSVPSPFFPVNDCAIYEDVQVNTYSHQSAYPMSKLW